MTSRWGHSPPHSPEVPPALCPLDVGREMSKVSLLLGYDFLNQAKFPERDKSSLLGCLDHIKKDSPPQRVKEKEGHRQKPEQRQAYF